MIKAFKRVLLVIVVLALFINCTKEAIQTPNNLDKIVGRWSPIVGLMTGEIVDGTYGKEAFVYNFGSCDKENGFIEFLSDGNFHYISYMGSVHAGCKLIEKSKQVVWERQGDSTYSASGVISQIRNQGTYVETNIENSVLAPYIPNPDLVEIKNDTLILYFDKIPNTSLYNERFFYKRKN